MKHVIFITLLGILPVFAFSLDSWAEDLEAKCTSMEIPSDTEAKEQPERYVPIEGWIQLEFVKEIEGKDNARRGKQNPTLLAKITDDKLRTWIGGSFLQFDLRKPVVDVDCIRRIQVDDNTLVVVPFVISARYLKYVTGVETWWRPNGTLRYGGEVHITYSENEILEVKVIDVTDNQVVEKVFSTFIFGVTNDSEDDWVGRDLVEPVLKEKFSQPEYLEQILKLIDASGKELLPTL